ncbi:MAG: hypothetical protein RL372_737 [Bacteroidota bacterium]
MHFSLLLTKDHWNLLTYGRKLNVKQKLKKLNKTKNYLIAIYLLIYYLSNDSVLNPLGPEVPLKPDVPLVPDIPS